MSSILYSLLVPTRNRPTTAECLIRHALTFFPENYEVVVQDCGAPGPLGDALKDVSSDPRLRYEHTGRPVSMTENWNRGIERCRGDYVSILGDDDAVTRELPSIVEWVSAHNIDALSGNRNRSIFCWPDFPDSTKAASYTMYVYTGKLVEYISRSLLDRAVGTFGYSEVRAMPHVYYGILRRAYLCRMAEQTGRCFQGYTPDFYAGYFLASIVPKTHWVDFPIFTPGACGASNSATWATAWTQSADRHKQEFDVIEWPDIVPEGSSAPAFIAEAVVRALRDAGRADLIASMKWPDFYLFCMLHDPALRWRNLARYWSVAGSVLGRSQLQRASDLGVGLVRRVRGKLRPRRDYMEPEFAPPKPEVFEQYSAVHDTTQLVALQADALRRQQVVPPWRLPLSQATLAPTTAAG
jgi:hypothetical protein